MNPARPRRPRTELDPNAYEQLRRQVFERDNWRCQNCGVSQNLQVHHRQLRSHLGGDSEDNLITLCCHCHTAAHQG